MVVYPTDEQAKAEIIKAGNCLWSRGLVAANDGNISARVSDRELWATPTGVSKGGMTEDMLVKLDMDGNIICGRMKPSSELKMHLRIYREDPSALAVVHAHPPVASAFAAAGVPLEKALLQETVVQLGTVPVAPYALPGSDEVGESLAPFSRSFYAVLLERHGAVTWGESVEKALFRMESVEHFARVTMYSHLMGFDRLMTKTETDRLVGLRNAWGIDRGGYPKCR